jgi:predicted nucleotidyltransferase
MRRKTLIHLLFPKTRASILAATLMHPEKWWYLADLSRHIGVPSSSLQRELDSLVEGGVLLRRREGKQVYFKPDTDCPLMPDLQGLMTKTIGLVDVLRDALSPFEDSIQVAFVYGSLARSEELSESDVDLMIVGDVKLADLSPKLQNAENRLGRQVNPMLYSQEEFSSKLRQGHHFLRSVCEHEKLFVFGGQHDLASSSQDETGEEPQDQPPRDRRSAGRR